MEVDLTVNELKIVVLLASSIGEYVPYRKIYDAVHYEGFVGGSGEHGYRDSVRSSIKRIRRKFQDYDPTFDEIRNHAGFGYCWGKRCNKEGVAVADAAN
jgi:two-component system response regulator ChvI